MEQKNIVATIYLKNGQAVRGLRITPRWLDVIELAKHFTMTIGIDKIIILISLTR